MRRGQEEIKTEAVSYFKHLFRDSGSHHLLEKIQTASLYPRLVTDIEAADLFKPVTLPEIQHILLLFKKERSPGPDGWTTEFFSHFFDKLQLSNNFSHSFRFISHLADSGQFSSISRSFTLYSSGRSGSIAIEFGISIDISATTGITLKFQVVKRKDTQ